MMSRKSLAVKTLVYLTFAICLTGVLFCVIYSVRHPTESNRETQSNKRTAQQEQRQVTAIEQAYPEPDREERDHEQSYGARWLDPIVILTTLLVFGVGITNYIYYRQLQKMRETVSIVGEQRDAMKSQLTTMEGQLRAMEKQADVSERSLAETKRIFDMTERPLIIATHAILPGFDEHYNEGIKVRPQVTFLNNGRTVAQKFKITIEVAAKERMSYPWGPPTTDVQPQGGYILGVGAATIMEGSPALAVSFTKEFFERAWRGKESLLIHGKGSYEDLAGRKYPLNYAFEFRPGVGFIPYTPWTDSEDEQ